MLRILGFLLLAQLTVHGQVNFESFAGTNWNNAVAVDGDGSVWVGTTGGVLKFHKDGTLLATYTNQDGLMHNQVTVIYIDSKGDKWFGTLYGGISRLQGDTWESWGNLLYYGTGNFPVESGVYDIVEDASGNMWFAVDNYLLGAAKFDGTNWTFYNDSNSAIANSFPYSLAVDADGTLWVGLLNAVSSFDGTNWVSYTVSGGSPSIEIDSNGDKWMMLFNKIVRLSGTTLTTFDKTVFGADASEYFNSIHVDSQDNLWLGVALSNNVGKGLIKYSIPTQETTRYTEPVAQIHQILEVDDELYLATGSLIEKGKAYRFDGSEWFEYSKENVLESNFVVSSLADASGNMWFGTYYGVTKFDGVTYTEYTTSNSGLASNRVFSLAQTSNGNIYAGTNAGVSVFQGGVWTSALGTSTVYGMDADSQGNLWITTELNGAAMYDGNSWTTYNLSNSGIGSNGLHALHVDANDDVWLGDITSASNRGIYLFSEGTFTSFTSENSGLGEGPVTSIVSDANGVVLAAVSDRGIYKYAEGQWTLAYTKDNSPIPTNSLTAMAVGAMAVDAAGRYWFGGFGVSVFDGTSWKVFMNGGNKLIALQVTSLSPDNQGNMWATTYWGASKISGDPFFKLDQAITFGELPEKTFGDAAFPLDASSDAGLALTFSSSDAAVATVDGNMVTIVGAGSSIITAAQVGNDDTNEAEPEQQLLTVHKAPLAVTAESKTRAYGDANPLLTFTYAGFKGADDAGVIDTEPTIATSATPTSNAGIYDIALTGGMDNNYDLTQLTNGALTVTKSALTAIAENKTKVYGDVNPGLTITYTGLKGLDNASVIDTPPTLQTTATTSSDAGSYEITLNGGTDNNYSITPTNGSLTINKANLTVAAENKSKTYGDVNPPLTIAYTGFKGADNAGTLDEAPAIETTAVAGSDAGTYPITLTGGADTNYDLQRSNGTFTINKASQAISFDAIADKVLGDFPFSLAATSSSALAVAFTSSSDKVTIAGDQVTILKAGRTTITANQAGNNNYNPATGVDQSFCIKPAKPTITLSGENTESPTLTSSAPEGNQWFKDGTVVTDAINATFSVSEAGIYKVQVTVDECASEFSDDKVLIVTEALFLQRSEFSVSPNPADEYVEVRGIAGEIGATQIFDMTGKLAPIVLQRVGDVHRGDVQHLRPGVYVLRLQEGNTLHLVKFIKR